MGICKLNSIKSSKCVKIINIKCISARKIKVYFYNLESGRLSKYHMKARVFKEKD